MTAILIVSTERYSGKSSLAVGLALELSDRGFQVGYMKPVGSYPIKADGDKVDEDAYFISEALGLEVPFTDLTPFFLTWDTINRYMRKRPADARSRVKASFDRLSEGTDVMLLEGAQDFVHGRLIGLSARELTGSLGLKVLLLDSFNEELSADRVLSAHDFWGDSFLGVVFNWVPERRLPFARNLMTRFLKGEGMEVFGAIPIDRVLRSITVSDLARGLGGEIVCAREKGDELVENMMVGAMGQEQALRLFRKQANKVVITGGDRADIQLAALDTPTRCLVLTGGHRPSQAVTGQADEMGVPIIVVAQDTAETVEMVDSAIGRQKFHGAAKIERVRERVREDVDLDLMLERAGLPPGKP